MLQVAKKFYKKPPAAPSRKEEKKAKGIESEAVKAFLEKQKREEEEKGAGNLGRAAEMSCNSMRIYELREFLMYVYLCHFYMRFVYV